MEQPTRTLPSIGARGSRVIDALKFACEVLAVNVDQRSLRVRFLDGDAATVEDGVDVDEFEPDPPSPRGAVVTPNRLDRFLVRIEPRGHSARCVLGLVATYLEPYEWLAGMLRVCDPWRRVLLDPRQWQTLQIRSCADRLSRLLSVQLVPDDEDQKAGVCVRDVVDTIVLDESRVTDDQVVSTATQCVQLQSISLRCCQQVSFMVVYELLRLSRERFAAGGVHLQTLDLWLCRGVSPTFVSQLTAPPSKCRWGDEPTRRHRLDIQGPGFFFIDVSNIVFGSLQKCAIDIPQWRVQEPQLEVLWLPESTLLELLDSKEDAEWLALKRFTPVLKAAALAGVVPLVPFDKQLLQISVFKYLGIPSNPVHVLPRLIREWRHSSIVQTRLERALHAFVDAATLNQTDTDQLETRPIDPLEAQAERVFAMLRQTTEQLQDQVARLESQVAVMTEAKLAAEREYKHAEWELQRVAQEADRAVLRLATSSDPTSSTSTVPDITSVIEPPPLNGIIVDHPEDATLPPLPSREAITRLAESLEQQSFVVLDGFVGRTLSTCVRHDVERMYLASRAMEDRPPLASSPDNPPPVPSQARFTLGELAGGHTGRNLRYQMTHIRGDYMLWLDEHDEACPLSIQLVLRQLDRLVLERLSVESHELSMSALLRKKAMVTCYPGKQNARYTRHCDNPNRNGRKLTAILYLNPDWDPALHGGELLVHRGAEGTRIAPLLDRLVLFFSDTRVPHEVLSCKDAGKDRFALTVWYLDYDEYMHAQVFGSTKEDGDAVERKRIEMEMERFAGAGCLEAAPTREEEHTDNQRDGHQH